MNNQGKSTKGASRSYKIGKEQRRKTDEVIYKLGPSAFNRYGNVYQKWLIYNASRAPKDRIFFHSFLATRDTLQSFVESVTKSLQKGLTRHEKVEAVVDELCASADKLRVELRDELRDTVAKLGEKLTQDVAKLREELTQELKDAVGELKEEKISKLDVDKKVEDAVGELKDTFEEKIKKLDVEKKVEDAVGEKTSKLDVENICRSICSPFIFDCDQFPSELDSLDHRISEANSLVLVKKTHEDIKALSKLLFAYHEETNILVRNFEDLDKFLATDFAQKGGIPSSATASDYEVFQVSKSSPELAILEEMTRCHLSITIEQLSLGINNTFLVGWVSEDAYDQDIRHGYSLLDGKNWQASKQMRKKKKKRSSKKRTIDKVE